MYVYLLQKWSVPYDGFSVFHGLPLIHVVCFPRYLYVVLITDLQVLKNLVKMLQISQIFLKLVRYLLCVVSHKLEY